MKWGQGRYGFGVQEQDRRGAMEMFEDVRAVHMADLGSSRLATSRLLSSSGTESVSCFWIAGARISLTSAAKLILISRNCPPLRKSEIEYYAMLSVFGRPDSMVLR